MKNSTYWVIWILTYRTCNCNISLNFWIFSKSQNEVEKDLVKLHFLSVNQIPKMITLKVTIEVDTFWMRGPLGVK